MAAFLDIDGWNRKEHFHFFRAMDLPYFGLVADLECSGAREYCRHHGIPFFVYYLHKCLMTCNQLENFKYRIEGDKVRIESKISVSPTIGREDHTFGFSFIEFDADFSVFLSRAEAEIAYIRSQSGLCLRPDTGRKDVIHFSALPWVNFTHLSHAAMVGQSDGVPKISVGKIKLQGERSFMPVSLHLHHALADGYHAGQFFELFEHFLNA